MSWPCLQWGLQLALHELSDPLVVRIFVAWFLGSITSMPVISAIQKQASYILFKLDTPGTGIGHDKSFFSHLRKYYYSKHHDATHIKAVLLRNIYHDTNHITAFSE
jgi:hypothetical protein